MQEVSRVELMPGVFLTGIQTGKFKSSYWSARLIAPLEKETAAMNALMPRLLRRGTAECPDQQRLAAVLDELYGGVIEPTVSKRGEAHCFGFAATFLDDALVPDERPLLDREARLLGDLLLRPATRNGRLRGDYVESERNNLAAEIRSEINDKQQYARRRLLEEMCASEPYGVDRLGALETLEKINVTRLNRHYHKLLSSARIELYYCGSAAPKRVEQAWREALMDLPRKGMRAEPATDWRVIPGDRRDFTDRLEVKQGKLVLGFRTGCGLNSPEYPALVVANALFGGTPSSRLFLNVREKQSLCYYASSVLDKHKGLMLVQSGVEFENFRRAEEEILAQLEALRQGDFTPQELEAARQFAASQFRTVLDSQPMQEDYWLSQAMAELRLAPQELAAALELVTREEVTEAIGRIRLDSVYRLMGKEEAAV